MTDGIDWARLTGGSQRRRNQNDAVTTDEQHGDIPLCGFVNLNVNIKELLSGFKIIFFCIDGMAVLLFQMK